MQATPYFWIVFIGLFIVEGILWLFRPAVFARLAFVPFGKPRRVITRAETLDRMAQRADHRALGEARGGWMGAHLGFWVATRLALFRRRTMSVGRVSVHPVATPEGDVPYRKRAGGSVEVDIRARWVPLPLSLSVMLLLCGVSALFSMMSIVGVIMLSNIVLLGAFAYFGIRKPLEAALSEVEQELTRDIESEPASPSALS